MLSRSVPGAEAGAGEGEQWVMLLGILSNE